MRLAVARIDQIITPVRIDGDGPDALAQPVRITGLTAPATDPWLTWIRDGSDRAALEDIGAPVPQSDLTLQAPLARPGKVIAIGLNYADHTAETGLTPPAEPLTFAKYPTSITGPTADIRVPRAVTTEVDWEVELAVVIGTTCGPDRPGTRADIAAYTVANDVSARDLQFSDGQWTRAKSIDTFCPLGPVLVTPEEISDPHALRIHTTVNGEIMQDATTGDLIFDVDFLIDYLSRIITLEPGDLILTGTPPGCGGFRTPPVFLADGDLVECGVEGIGALRNRVRFVR